MSPEPPGKRVGLLNQSGDETLRLLECHSLLGLKRNLEDLSQTCSLISMRDSFVSAADPTYPVPSEGWAMRVKKAGGHLPPKAKKIVEEYFEETQAADERCYLERAIELIRQKEAH